jgi:hypothetical protein
MAVPGSHPARTNAGQCGDGCGLRGEDAQHLLNLCTVSPNDPRYREALHFCHGYLVGAYHYHVAETAGEGGKRLVCFPTPPPSRNEAFRMFIAWMQAHPQYMNEPPVETEFRFLTEQWPCQQ